LPFLAGAFAKSKVHDDTFTPDYILEATLDDIKINCKSRSSITFNGTSPGPTIYLREEQTTWIRVYNKIPDNNVTVVSLHVLARFFKANKISTGMV
jgi:L-ascorbate oxidase